MSLPVIIFSLYSYLVKCINTFKAKPQFHPYWRVFSHPSEAAEKCIAQEQFGVLPSLPLSVVLLGTGMHAVRYSEYLTWLYVGHFPD